MTLNDKTECIWHELYAKLESTTGQDMKKILKANNGIYNFKGIKKYGCDSCLKYKEGCKAYLPTD